MHRLTYVGEPAAREFCGAAKRGGTELGLRRLLERDQERDGGFGIPYADAPSVTPAA